MNVSRGPHRICVAPRAGWDETFGRRSSAEDEGRTWEEVLEPAKLGEEESIGRRAARMEIDCEQEGILRVQMY